MRLPSSGTLFGDTSTMVDPHKFGSVMWARTPNDLLSPLDLHGKIPVSDEQNLDIIGDLLKHTRKVTPSLEVVQEKQWIRMDIIKPYLIASMEGRSEARQMRVDDQWEAFWSSY